MTFYGIVEAELRVINQQVASLTKVLEQILEELRELRKALEDRSR